MLLRRGILLLAVTQSKLRFMDQPSRLEAKVGLLRTSTFIISVLQVGQIREYAYSIPLTLVVRATKGGLASGSASARKNMLQCSE